MNYTVLYGLHGHCMDYLTIMLGYLDPFSVDYITFLYRLFDFITYAVLSCGITLLFIGIILLLSVRFWPVYMDHTDGSCVLFDVCIRIVCHEKYGGLRPSHNVHMVSRVNIFARSFLQKLIKYFLKELN